MPKDLDKLNPRDTAHILKVEIQGLSTLQADLSDWLTSSFEYAAKQHFLLSFFLGILYCRLLLLYQLVFILGVSYTVKSGAVLTEIG